MKTLTALLFASALCILPMNAQSKWKDEFAKHLSTSKDFTIEVAKAMPADGYSFKPNPEEMSFGELIVHIAQSQSNAFARATGGKSPLVKPEKADKEAAVKYLTDALITALRCWERCRLTA
jgi:hypothetical protein